MVEAWPVGWAEVVAIDSFFRPVLAMRQCCKKA